jgi:phosphoglycerate kinase
MKSIKDMGLKGKRVLLRVDINVPMKGSLITDDSRIRAIIPTIQSILAQDPQYIIILAHQGRSHTSTPDSILNEHAKSLEKLLHQRVLKIDTCRPTEIPEDAKIILLENVRLDDEKDEDKKKRMAFALHLSKLGDVYVNDAFAVSHRDHASITTLPSLMSEKGIGLLLEKEINALSPLLTRPKYPLTLILGGAKIDTKIGLIHNFISHADNILVGGALANTFLAAQGFSIGQSFYQKEKVETAREIMMQADADDERFVIPQDVICASKAIDDAETIDIPVEDIIGDMSVFDIGQKTITQFKEIITNSATIIWNGPLGFFEKKPFQNGSFQIAKALAESSAQVIIGGGDSIAVLNEAGLSSKQFHHVSTGGGAMLEFLGGKKLPGLKALAE